ncbi:PIN domain-containing protein [Streptomyces omiyaensis]|uniref:PIN domain-containing protein n=1 Tax=Streptomyces omiyaensis TaxID=68247 RepID=A0ABW7BY86_9ACTN
MLITLDTNLIPRKGILRSVEISTILRIASALGARVALTQTVLAESISARRRDVQEAMDAHSRTVQKLGNFCSVDAYYIPSVDAVVDDWEAQLRSAFEELPLSGDDAVEALEREALRIKPSKSNGTGGRDAAIWLTIKRAHLATTGPTHFASNNSEDFAIRKGSDTLHPDLAQELGERLGDFTYHKDLKSIIRTLCSEAEVSIGAASFPEDLSLSIIDQIVAHNDLKNFADFADVSPDEVGPIEKIILDSLRVRSAYSAEGVVVGFLTAKFTLALAAEVHETLGTAITGALGGWFEMGNEAVALFDITVLRDVRYERPWGPEDDAFDEIDAVHPG